MHRDAEKVALAFEAVQGCELSCVESEWLGINLECESRAKWPCQFVGKHKQVCNSQCKPFIQQDFEARFSVTVVFHMNPY